MDIKSKVRAGVATAALAAVVVGGVAVASNATSDDRPTLQTTGGDVAEETIESTTTVAPSTTVAAETTVAPSTIAPVETTVAPPPSVITTAAPVTTQAPEAPVETTTTAPLELGPVGPAPCSIPDDPDECERLGFARPVTP